MKEKAPYEYVNNYQRLEYYADAVYDKPAPYVSPYQPTDFVIDGDMSDWVRDCVGAARGSRPKSLVLIGESRLGKTAWARSVGPHWYFNGLFNMDVTRGDADYAVLDDINMEFFLSQYKGWLGAQEEFTMTDKYRHKAKLMWGRPCIWCSNEDPRSAKGVDRDWLDANCIFVHVYDKLF